MAREFGRLPRSLPKTVVCDHGLKFTSKLMFLRAKEAGREAHFIWPGNPSQNAFVQSFKGGGCDYCLDLTGVARLGDTRSIIDTSRDPHNQGRPSRSLGRKSSAMFSRAVA